MSANHVPFWIASDLLAQARAHGVVLSEDFSAQLLGIVRGEQKDWMTGRREAEDDRRRQERRRASQQRGWF